MTNRKNIKVSEEWYNEHKPRKEELGLSWEKYLSDTTVDVEDPVDYAEIENRLGGTGVDSRELGEATADYLMAEYNLPQKVAEKLR